eukprot:363864-Chlamydomonas_euryale.AAC.26
MRGCSCGCGYGCCCRGVRATSALASANAAAAAAACAMKDVSCGRARQRDAQPLPPVATAKRPAAGRSLRLAHPARCH